MDNELLKTIVTIIGGGVLAIVGQAIVAHYSLKAKQLELQMEETKQEDAEQTLPAHEPVLYLLGHPLFNELDNAEMFFLTRFKLKDPVRTRIVIEIAVHKIRIWRAALRQVAMESQQFLAEHIATDNRAFVHQAFCASYNKAMVDYVSWHKKPGALSVDGTLAYDAGSIATMDIAIDSFKVEHAPAETIVWVAINDISESNTYYNEDFRRCWDIFTIYMFAFVQFKLDSERSMSSLNGRLTGRPFLDNTTVGDL